MLADALLDPEGRASVGWVAKASSSPAGPKWAGQRDWVTKVSPSPLGPNQPNPKHKYASIRFLPAPEEKANTWLSNLGAGRGGKAKNGK